MEKFPVERRETQPEIAEYNYEEGAAKIMEIIQHLLDQGPDYAAIGFCASGTDVGKTHLSGRLARRLTDAGIPTIICSEIDNLSEGKILLLKQSQQILNKQKGVVIFEALFSSHTRLDPKVIKFIRDANDRKLSSAAATYNLPLEKIDLWVGLYRPDKPFEGKENEQILADILIRNEQARDSKTKMRINNQ